MRTVCWIRGCLIENCDIASISLVRLDSAFRRSLLFVTHYDLRAVNVNQFHRQNFNYLKIKPF